MIRNKKTQKRHDIPRSIEKTYNYLVSLEKEYRKNIQDKRVLQYTVNEGDMGSVKTINVAPISINPSSV